MFDDILKFAGTDMLCYRAAEPEGLVARPNGTLGPDPYLGRRRARRPLHPWLGVVHQEQPAAAINAYAGALRSYATPLGLACLHTITSLTGSALLAIAFAEKRIKAEEAWGLAHLDEDWQIEHWGTDEEAFQRREHRWQDMLAATRTLDALR